MPWIKKIASLLTGFVFVMIFVYASFWALDAHNNFILLLEAGFFIPLFTRRMWEKRNFRKVIDAFSILCFSIVFVYGTGLLMRRGHEMIGAAILLLFLILMGSQVTKWWKHTES